jgi:methylated-DNA-[protein]-cysteine S-methyltransferase
MSPSSTKHMGPAETTQTFSCLRRTRFGPIAVLWSVYEGQPKIFRVLLSQPDLPAERIVRTSFPDVKYASCAEIDCITDRLVAFLLGQDEIFPLDTVRMDLCSSFQQKVLCAEHGIPRGRVSTYQRIAGHLGDRRAARAVGAALATNPFPIIVPCHRAIRSDGTMGGFQGGTEMKAALLRMEGILFSAAGRLVTERYFY